jgi:CRP/FNR family transcriptional regulator, cyclic AMP receptor protein
LIEGYKSDIILRIGHRLREQRVQVSEAYLSTITQSFGCADDIARVIAATANARSFPAHAIMIRAGDADPDAWLMLSGEAQAIAYAPGGQYVLIHSFTAGDLFGEAAGLSIAASDAEVAVVSAVEAGQFAVGAFISLMERYNCVALSVARTLTQRLTQTTRRMVEGATLSAPGRIHAELLRQARAGADMTITPMPVLSNFALHVQSTRETVSRTIGALEKRGIIKRDGDGLTVVAPHRLEELIF